MRQRILGFSDLYAIQSGAALVSPQDPGNVGINLRTIAAVGADALFLLGGGRGLVPSNMCARRHRDVILEAGRAGRF